MSTIINNLPVFWLVFSLLLITLPAYAEKNYFFPAEVIEQVQYPTESSGNYKALPEQRFPEPSSRFQRNVSYPQEQQYPINYQQNQYARDYSETKAPHQLYSRNKFRGPDKSDLYQFDNYKTDVYSNVRPAPSAQPYPLNNFNYGTAYPEENYPEASYSERSHSVRSDYESYRSRRLPALENKRYQLKQIDYSNSSQKPLYASDIKPDKPPVNKNSYQKFSPDSKSYPQRHNDTHQVQIQYVPVPVYNAPRTLPGTVPGVVVPGNMVPGYSHLTPNLSNNSVIRKGMGSLPGTHYNPFSGYSVFSGGPHLFDSLYSREYSDPPIKRLSAFPETQEP